MQSHFKLISTLLCAVIEDHCVHSLGGSVKLCGRRRKSYMYLFCRSGGNRSRGHGKG